MHGPELSPTMAVPQGSSFSAGWSSIRESGFSPVTPAAKPSAASQTSVTERNRMSRAARRFFRHGLLPQLMVFDAVARLGSVTRAAEELHLAQPTVSLQLKKLADTLDVTLFEQRGRRLHL